MYTYVVDTYCLGFLAVHDHAVIIVCYGWADSEQCHRNKLDAQWLSEGRFLR